MKAATVAIATVLMASTAGAHPHPLGTPHIVFCDQFVREVAGHLPIRYSLFVRYTDGAGMPIAADRRHWDGLRGSYLTVELYRGFVKGGFVSCPGGATKTFGAWTD